MIYNSEPLLQAIHKYMYYGIYNYATIVLFSSTKTIVSEVLEAEMP